MSLTASIWAWKQPMGNPLRKLVLLHMADSASDQNDWQSWYSLTKIAERCDCSRGAVRTHIKALVDGGYLTLTKPASRHGRAAKYRLNVGAVEIQIGPGNNGVGGAGDIQGGAGDVPEVVQEMYQGGTGDVPKPVIEPVTKPERETTKKNPPPEFVKMVLALYAEILPELQQVFMWDKKQDRAVNLAKIWKDDSRIDTRSEDFWRAYFEHVRTSDWWMGRSKDSGGNSFACTFEFLVRPKQALRIIEGSLQSEAA